MRPGSWTAISVKESWAEKEGLTFFEKKDKGHPRGENESGLGGGETSWNQSVR